MQSSTYRTPALCSEQTGPSVGRQTRLLRFETISDKLQTALYARARPCVRARSCFPYNGGPSMVCDARFRPLSAVLLLSLLFSIPQQAHAGPPPSNWMFQGLVQTLNTGDRITLSPPHRHGPGCRGRCLRTRRRQQSHRGSERAGYRLCACNHRAEPGAGFSGRHRDRWFGEPVCSGYRQQPSS